MSLRGDFLVIGSGVAGLRAAISLADARARRCGATELVIRDGVCVGATYIGNRGDEHTVNAAQTLLATGGAGQVFRETTNPAIAAGDGVAMAARAGARVTDLEFVQFHPTVLSVEGFPRFLLSEALRGAHHVRRRGAHGDRIGVETDLDARTSVAGLLAAGEVACTGGPGANRLASNSLLEGLVFGARAAAAMTAAPSAAALRPCDVTEWPAPRGSGEALPEAAMVREVMWRHAGSCASGGRSRRRWHSSGRGPAPSPPRRRRSAGLTAFGACRAW